MSVTLQLQIGSHRFKVRVEEQERERMIAAARRVEEMFTQRWRVEKVADGERAALMVALELATSTNTVDSNSLAQIEVALDEALAASDS